MHMCIPFFLSKLDIKTEKLFNCYMKKISLLLICLMFCLSFASVNFAFADSSLSTYVITANQATIFAEANFASSKLVTLSNNTRVSVEMQDEKPVEYNSNGYVFFKIIDFQGQDGFVYSDLLTPQANVVTAIPSFNAQTARQCNVFFMQDNTLVQSDITLASGERVYLYQGYDNTLVFNGHEYNAIAFVNDNEVLYGYLPIENIIPDGVNPVLITCIVVIIALLGIIFAWLFMKNKKVKIKKSKTPIVKEN